MWSQAQLHRAVVQPESASTDSLASDAKRSTAAGWMGQALGIGNPPCDVTITHGQSQWLLHVRKGSHKESLVLQVGRLRGSRFS